MFPTEKLQISIQHEDGIFLAITKHLNMYGYGYDKSEAIQDLRESLTEYYDVLKTEQKNLGKIPQSDYEYLTSIL